MQPHRVEAIGTRSQQSAKFRIYWQGEINWGLKLQNDIPFHICQSAITELLNRQGGMAFLCPSLAKAAGVPLIKPAQLTQTLAVEHIHEGGDSAIFKVTAEATLSGQAEAISFCLIVSRGPHNNQLHYDIPRNLFQLRKSYPGLVVRPFYIGHAKALYQGNSITLTMYSAEWLENSLGLTSCNCAELDQQRTSEKLGLRQLMFNNPTSDKPADIFLEPKLETKVAIAMAKTLVLFFDPYTGKHIQQVAINAGDFVYLKNSDGSFSVKLTTCREIGLRKSCKLSPGVFIATLLFYREHSYLHQTSSILHDEAERFSVFTFTPLDVCQGTKEALCQRYGIQKGTELLLTWLDDCQKALINDLRRHKPPTEKIAHRYEEGISVINDFLRDETVSAGY